MTISINQELCDGCGACVEACPNSAICLFAGKAKIDDLLCTTCETCYSLCPVEAIQRESVSTPTVYLPNASGISGGDIQLSKPADVQAPSRDLKPGSLLERLGSALFALGREVLPYVAEGLTTVVEHRIASSRVGATTSAQPAVRSDVSRAGRSSHLQRRRRIRRGRI